MKKKILIIVPGALYPTVMASQVRIKDIISNLNIYHIVDVVTMVKTSMERNETSKQLDTICNRHYIIQKPNNYFLSRVFFSLVQRFLNFLLIQPFDCFYPNLLVVQRKILKIIRKNKYDIIQVEYWFQGSILRKINNVYKVIDTHDILHQKRFLNFNYRKKKLSNGFYNRWLEMYKNKELNVLNNADLIISISQQDLTFFKKAFPHKEHFLMPSGQDIKYFSKKEMQDRNINNILYYGAMNSEQNIDGFWRLWKNIYPKITKEIKCNLIILGGAPPKEIKELGNLDNVIVTDFVEDIRGYIAISSFMILPLRLAAGFRSRVIEVMAMGVPVIGTHNALHSIEMKNGVHGYITDDDNLMARYAVDLLKNNNLLAKMSKACTEFIREKYSYQATYYKLADYYSNIEEKNFPQ